MKRIIRIRCDERESLYYGVVHSIIRSSFALQQTLAKRERGRMYHILVVLSWRDITSSDTSPSSLISYASMSMPCIRFQTTKRHLRDHMRCKEKSMMTIIVVGLLFAQTGPAGFILSTGKALLAAIRMILCHMSCIKGCLTWDQSTSWHEDRGIYVVYSFVQ